MATMAIIPMHWLPIREDTALPQQSLDLFTYPSTGLQTFAQFIIVFFPVISVTVVALRLYGRVTTRTVSLDDIFIIGATVSCLDTVCSVSIFRFLTMYTCFQVLAAVEAVFSFVMIKVTYIGVHVWQLPAHSYDPTVGNFINYIVVILYNPELALVKSSALFFLLRLGGHQTYLRRFIQILNWSNIALLVAVLFASIFTCIPIPKYWNRSIEGNCNNEALQYIVTSSITVLTDVLVLIIPIKIVIGLQMTKKIKMILICLLCAGAM